MRPSRPTASPPSCSRKSSSSDVSPMALNQQIDQDALAAEWGLALEEDSGAQTTDAAAGPAATGVDEAAAQWAAMVDDGTGFQAKGGAERILNQEEIDS